MIPFGTNTSAGLLQQKWAKILGLSLVAIVVIGIFSLLYYELYYLPKEEKLQEKLWVSILDLKNQNYQDAFFGTEDHYGFDALAHENHFSSSSNLAKYGAGISALKLQNYEQAIVYLSAVTFDEPVLEALSKMALADAFLESTQVSEALKYYEKAWKSSQNTAVSPIAAKKLAELYQNQNKFKEALTIYKKALEELPAHRKDWIDYFQKSTARLEASSR